MKKTSTLKDYIALLQIIKPRTIPFVIGTVGHGAVSASIYIMIGLIMKFMVDSAVKDNSRYLTYAIILSLATAVGAGILLYAFNYLRNKCAKHAMADLQKKVFTHIEHLPNRYFEKHHSGEVISKLSNDIGSIENAFTSNIYMIVFAVFFGMGSIVSMFILDWRFAVLFIAIGALTSYVNVFFSRNLRKINDKLLERLGKLTEKTIDLISGIVLVKMFPIRKKFIQQYSDLSEDTFQSYKDSQRKNAGIESMNFFINWGTYVLTLVIGSILFLSNSREFGTIIAIGQLLNGVTFLFGSINTFIGNLHAPLAAASRIKAILEEETEHLNGSVVVRYADNNNECIVLKDVSFDYDDGTHVLDNINMLVKQGEIAVLSGPSGSGKSTIIKILTGLVPIKHGEVYVNLKQFKSGLSSETSVLQLRNVISYIPQNAFLFDTTIRENISFGRLGATNDEIIMAAKEAHAHDFIMSLPDQYDTMVGSNGVLLSGGQKQRIAIARCILKNAPIILMDEATSSLDPETEAVVQKALATLIEGKTVITITHKKESYGAADVIYTLANGTLKEDRMVIS
ncbi:ABC transporter ATP-binding protein [Paenibacillus tengchongensis]|uniref:ABC transporter ATP-binding protein n=1 Tax=Paenibacillus tengchongensis TaxID=2608684 RepID=UPI00124C7FAE|nr:ABC transporter ATP-binding protein [Paenibacillus tengchongensis]